MLRQISLNGKLDPTQMTSELPLSLIVHSLHVLLQGGLVLDHSRTQWTGDDFALVDGVDVSVQRAASSEFLVTLGAFVTLLTTVGF